MTHLNRSTHDRIVELIIPLARTESERRGLLSSAFSDHPALIDRVDLSGSASVFAAHLLQTLLDYGEIEPGVPAVWRLLERIRNQVGADKQRQIDTLKPAIMAALSGSAPSVQSEQMQPEVKSLSRLPIVGIIAMLLIAVVIGASLLRPSEGEPPITPIPPSNTPTPTPTLTPTQAAAVPAPTETTAITLEPSPMPADSTQTPSQPASGAPPTAFTLFRDADSLTLFIPGSQPANLGDLTLTVDGSNAPALASYPAFAGLPMNALPTPICLRLERSGSAQPLPQACPADTTVTQQLADADVFWRASNQERTILIRRGGVLITFCAAGQSRCDFAYSGGGGGSGSSNSNSNNNINDDD
jgi:hypothetical protein